MKTNVLKFDQSRRQHVKAPQPQCRSDHDDYALEVFLIVDHDETMQAIKTALGYAP